MSTPETALPWVAQSSVTDVGDSGPEIDGLPSDISGIRGVSKRLVSHYMGNSDGSSAPVKGERLKEVDTRFADAMFRRLKEMGPLDGERPPDKRVVGCCRDYSVLFVSIARRKGIPSRIRAGYANYFISGWYLDHVIAEVWDGSAQRWRLVEPEIDDKLASRAGFDPLDVPPDRFISGPLAWMAARSGKVDPARFVVSPDFLEPYTRGWLSLRHHVVQDLAALNKEEMLVWDQWGILDEADPLKAAETLDSLAQTISDPRCPALTVSEWGRKEGLRVPRTVSSYSPVSNGPMSVDVARVLEGALTP